VRLLVGVPALVDGRLNVSVAELLLNEVDGLAETERGRPRLDGGYR
jgi:hypothetical protein